MIKKLKIISIIPILCLLLWGCSTQARAETIIAEDITEDTTWLRSSSPYILEGSWTVQENATLTIEPGVVIKMRRQPTGKGVFGVTGRLNAVGTQAEPIVFTSYDDSGPGEWSGILFLQMGQQRASGLLEHVVIRNGGRDISAIKLEAGADVTILNSEVRNSQRNGIEARNGSTLDIRESVISDTEIGLLLSQTELTYKENIIQNSRSYPMELDADDVAMIENSQFINNGIERIRIQRTSGVLTTDATWQAYEGLAAYELTSSLTVEKDATFTIMPGVQILLDSSSMAGIYVEGTLAAEGTEGAPILFTSKSDSAAPGQWEGLTFRGGIGRLDHVIIRHGGSSWANVRLTEEADVTIYHSEITSSGQHGVEVNDSTLEMTCSTIEDNERHGILHNSGISKGSGLILQNNGGHAVQNVSDETLDFRYNWWGDVTDVEEEIAGDVIYLPVLDDPSCELYDLAVTVSTEATKNHSKTTEQAQVAEPLTYTIQIANISPNQSPVHNIILSHDLFYAIPRSHRMADFPQSQNNGSITLMEASQGECSEFENRIRCTLGTIDFGDIATITIVFIPDIEGLITSQTTVDARENDVVSSNSTHNRPTFLVYLPFINR